MARVDNPNLGDLVKVMRVLATQTLDITEDLHLLYVTNLQFGEVTDRDSSGLLNMAQYYTRTQTDEIIRSFQGLGLTVESFFNEIDFLAAVATLRPQPGSRQRLVYTTAEGGRGSGRRALIPAVCNLLGLPVLNSGAHACSIARHKFHANAVLKQVGVRTPQTWYFDHDRWKGGTRPEEGSRVIIKPTYEGGCIGVDDDSLQIVDSTFDSFVQERNAAFRQPIVVQDFISGEEVLVPVIQIDAPYALSPMAHRRLSGEAFGSQPKTFESVLRHDFILTPYQTSSASNTALLNAAARAFDALEMRGVGRIDFRVDADDRAWVIDTNESPPPLRTTSHALAMNSLGFRFDEMLAVWLGVCLYDNGLVSGVR